MLITRSGLDSGRKAGITASATLTLDAFVSQIYLPHAKTRKRSWEVDERIARRHLSPVFGHQRLDWIKPLDVERWLANLRLGGLAPATCNRILATLKSICALAELFGHIIYGLSPCRQVRPLKTVIRQCRFLSVAEGKMLLAHLRKNSCQAARALQLLLLTGARKSEILRARWEDLDLDHKVLTVPLAKSGKPRHIYLCEEAVQVFRQIGRRPAAGWIFPGRDPQKPISDIYHYWDRTRRQLGLADVRIHDLRHTFASYLVGSGHTLYEAQQLLGHSDPRITMRYAHFVQRALVQAANSVGLLLAGSSPGRRKSPFLAGNFTSRRKL